MLGKKPGERRRILETIHGVGQRRLSRALSFVSSPASPKHLVCHLTFSLRTLEIHSLSEARALRLLGFI